MEELKAKISNCTCSNVKDVVSNVVAVDSNSKDVNVNIIYSHSRKLTESLKTFVNPLLPAWCCLTSFKFSFRSFFFRFFCLVSCFLSQFKRKSANYLLQICKCNFLLFKTQDEKVNWWTENRNKNKTHLARRKLGNAVENVWKRWNCSRS